MILNGLPWKRTEIILSFLRLHPSTVFQTILLTMMATPFLKGFLSTVVDADDTTLMAERQEELKSLLMKVKEESEKLA